MQYERLQYERLNIQLRQQLAEEKQAATQHKEDLVARHNQVIAHMAQELQSSRNAEKAQADKADELRARLLAEVAASERLVRALEKQSRKEGRTDSNMRVRPAEPSTVAALGLELQACRNDRSMLQSKLEIASHEKCQADSKVKTLEAEVLTLRRQLLGTEASEASMDSDVGPNRTADRRVLTSMLRLLERFGERMHQDHTTAESHPHVLSAVQQLSQRLTDQVSPESKTLSAAGFAHASCNITWQVRSQLDFEGTPWFRLEAMIDDAFALPRANPDEGSRYHSEQRTAMNGVGVRCTDDCKSIVVELARTRERLK
jgi:hypothetical protein